MNTATDDLRTNLYEMEPDLCENCGKIKRSHREIHGQLVCYPDTFPDAPMIFSGVSGCMGFTPEILLKWLLERRSNCERIVAVKTGQDQRGWIEDMVYFDAVIDFIRTHKRALLSPKQEGARVQ